MRTDSWEFHVGKTPAPGDLRFVSRVKTMEQYARCSPRSESLARTAAASPHVMSETDAGFLF